MVCDALNKMLSSAESIEAIAREAVASYEDDDAAVQRIEKERNECDKGIKNIVKAIAAGLDEPELHDELRNLKQRKAELTAIYSTISQGGKKTYEEWVDFLSNFCNIKLMSDVDKKAIIQTYVDRVLVFRAPDPNGGKDPYYEIEIELNPNHIEPDDRAQCVVGRKGRGLPLPPYPQHMVYKNGVVVIRSGG